MKEGYFGVSFGDIVRGFAFERHKDKPDPITRENTTETSNWLRETRGPDAVLVEVLSQFEASRDEGNEYKGVVLWSIRAPIEVDFILDHGGEIIWVEATDEVRYNRNVASQREGERHLSFEEFIDQEKKQWIPQPGIPKEVQMDVKYVKDHATRVFENNNNDLNAFLKKAHDLIEELGVD